LIAFVLAAFTTVLTIIGGYLTYSIPDNLLNDVDHALISLLRSPFPFADKATTPRSIGSEKRTTKLQAFLLDLSDQQLLTGLALLIAGVIRHTDITLYSLDVIAALLLLSSTVHLGTIPILRPILRSSRLLKWMRIIPMGAKLIGIVALWVMKTTATWEDAPDTSDIFFKCAIEHFSLEGTSRADATLFILLAVIFLAAYTNVFISLHGPRGGPRGLEDQLSRWLYNIFGIQGLPSQQQYLQHKSSVTRTKGFFSHLQGLHLAESFAFHECFQSFAWHILWLLFIQAFSMGLVFVNRQQTGPISGSLNNWGFGQIVALAMLALPVYSAVTNYLDPESQAPYSGLPNAPHEMTQLKSPKRPTAAPMYQVQHYIRTSQADPTNGNESTARLLSPIRAPRSPLEPQISYQAFQSRESPVAVEVTGLEDSFDTNPRHIKVKRWHATSAVPFSWRDIRHAIYLRAAWTLVLAVFAGCAMFRISGRLGDAFTFCVGIGGGILARRIGGFLSRLARAVGTETSKKIARTFRGFVVVLLMVAILGSVALVVLFSRQDVAFKSVTHWSEEYLLVTVGILCEMAIVPAFIAGYAGLFRHRIVGF
jgi:hypothetical protein